MADSPHPVSRLGPLIATGRTADVHAWDDGRVVKLMLPQFGEAQAREEAVAARLAAHADIGAPAFDGVVTVGDRSGLVYERIDGLPMTVALAGRPWMVRVLAARFGDLHAAVHGADAPGLPDVRELLAGAIRSADVDAGARRAALRRLEGMPAGSALLHGDMHPANVLTTADRPRIIDWIQGARGAPAADVARTLFLLRDSGVEPDRSARERLVIGVLRRAFASAYLRAYRRARPLDLSEIRAWRLPVLVARLAEGIVHERARLERLIRSELT